MSKVTERSSADELADALSGDLASLSDTDLEIAHNAAQKPLHERKDAPAKAERDFRNKVAVMSDNEFYVL
jgi:hypothetical protein